MTVHEKPQDFQSEVPVHHYNLIDQPVFHDSRNPSAVSYWAAIASHGKQQIRDGVSWKAVVSSQAAKWVDPCFLDQGVEIPENLRARENSTALRNFVTGLTTIRYMPWGSWMGDRYDPDQEIPGVISAEFHELMSDASSRANGFQGLQRPHFMTPDDGDIIMNDNGSATSFSSRKMKQKKWETLESRGSTNLRMVDSGTERTYSFKGMEESRMCEIVDKYETANILVTDLPFQAESDNTVEGNQKEADADEIQDGSSEAETDVTNDAIAEREPVHHKLTLPNTKASVAPNPSEGAPEEGKAFGCDMPNDDLQYDSVGNEEPDREQEPEILTNTNTGLVVSEFQAIEEPVEQLEEEPEANEPANIDLKGPSEYGAETALDDGKDILTAIKAQSYQYVWDKDYTDEDSGHDSIAGAGYDETDYTSTWAKRPKPEDHPKAKDLARFADSVDIFDSGTEEAPGAAQTPFHQALVRAKEKAGFTIANRTTVFEDDEAPWTPVRSKFGFWSPLQDNSQTPILRARSPTASRVPWNPNFTWGSRPTHSPFRKRILLRLGANIESDIFAAAAATAVSGESSRTHSRQASSSSEAVSTESGTAHTRNTSLSEPPPLTCEEERSREPAAVQATGNAAPGIGQHGFPVPVVVVEATAVEGAPPSSSVLVSPEANSEGEGKGNADALVVEESDGQEEEEEEEEKEEYDDGGNAVFEGFTSHFLVIVGIVALFLWPVTW